MMRPVLSPRRLLLGSLLGILLGLAQPAVAQWSSLLDWTPLAAIADLPRGSAEALNTSQGLLGPAPRIGVFWSGRNPAALPREMTTRHAELAAIARGVGGEFRRPLDAPAITTRGAVAIGWQPVGTRAAMIGHALLDEARVEPGHPTLQLEPHGSSPFVVTDSTSTPYRSSRARLDGAGGWRTGSVAFGFSLAFEAVDASTTTALVPRFSRASRPAAAAGIMYALDPAAIRIGAYARATRPAATQRTFARGGTTLVTRLNGFAAPVRTNVSQTVSPPWYYRRSSAAGYAAGVSLAQSKTALAWAAHVEGGFLEEDSWTREQANPPTDHWKARSVAVGGALQRASAAGSMLTVHGNWTRVAGDARMAQSDSVFYRAVESALHTAAELRWKPDASPWHVMGAIALNYERRDRGDTLANSLRTRLEALTTRIRGEVARELGSDLSVATGYAFGRYLPRGSVPRAQYFPAAIRPLVAGETAFYSNPHQSHTGSLTGLWHVNHMAALRMSAEYGRSAPEKSDITDVFTPAGERTQWAVSLSVILR